MTESSNGLRFDIYERVQLTSDALPIDTLEEIELSPHIEALEQEDSVLLRGYLLLSGTYRPIGQEDTVGTLEHRIPVEISLPQSRVRQLEELDVEIDHFDVDLLTERSLNVTGVLGLRGVQTEAREAPVWLEDGFTVAHDAPERVSATEAEQRDELSQAFSLPPLGEFAFESAEEAGANAGFGGTPEEERPIVPFSAGSQPHSPVYSQPGPVYLPPAWTDPNAAQEASASPVWYEQQRARAEAEARAREEALLRQQELAQVAAEALERQLAEAARANAELEARAAEEARAYELAEREKAEREALEAIALAERDKRLEEERDRQEEAEAWERLLAYQRLEEEPAEFIAPAETGPAQSEPPSYPQVYETNISAPPAWPGFENEVPAQEQAEAADSDEAAAPHRQPEPAGPKLGLSSKGAGGTESAFGVGILSQLGDKGAIREAGLKAAEEARLAAPPENTQNSRATGDEIEWTRLFLAKEAGQSFRKVKMVIVQREDTLDGIAGKYQLQSRELQLYNRLPDPHLAEGQVLYIP
ncbi:LysM peptidoglycan-binding domain-containing protein [Cohnella ginsengisoli]|uniref:LysM peptidoglycan-binding domain-containing protein n=1 Tax=Cohnella ginsengisoli TaxID=425004 RepID=A0A9X4QL86_9BACL|nr:LysM peptidoglycan-binding domain-containing protein [Cohnella ginsengisoli]MDG0790205.1 LysM peptidoglycan-binding domain-containing protein [Cohnella ginsengisoli]